MDIKLYSISEIKQYIDKNTITEVQLIKLAEDLKVDRRKNIQALGEKILRDIIKNREEVKRVSDMYSFDKSFGEYNIIAGVDEVGRGPFAGPIVAAAVVLNHGAEEDNILFIKDSKALSKVRRKELSEIIYSKAIDISIALISNDIIDEKGIGWCNNEVFKRAVSGLKVKPDIVISDGYPIKNFNIKNEFAVKGDAKSASIACASIVAKVYRDNIMDKYAEEYPEYGFSSNVGYGTGAHIEAIKKYGITKLHRKSFLKNIL